MFYFDDSIYIWIFQLERSQTADNTNHPVCKLDVEIELELNDICISDNLRVLRKCAAG